MNRGLTADPKARASGRSVMARFAAALRNAPMMVWMADRDGAFTFVNRKWLTFTGRPRKDELGDGWTGAVHPDDLARCLGEYHAARRTHHPFTIEYRLRRADNVYRWVSDSALPVYDVGGTFAGYVGTCVDVTQQREGSAALERTIEHLRLVAANADEMIYRYRYGTPGRLEYITPGVERIIGMSVDEVAQDPTKALARVHPDDQARLQYLLADPPDPTQRVTVRWVHRDGRVVWAEHRRLPVFDRDGNLVAVDGVAIDVTRQKQLEHERDAQIALLDALIAHMHDGVLAETDDGRVAVVNGAFRRMFGVPAEPAGGTAHSLTQHVRATLAEPDKWTPRRAAPEWRETELALADGRAVAQQYYPVTLDDGRIIHMWQFRDVTARRQAAEALIASGNRVRELSAHLEKVREDERRTLSRELHDELGQLLTSVRLEVASAVEKFQGTRTEAAFDVVDRLQSAVGLVDLSIATVRRLTSALRPPMLDHLGLVAAIRWEAALFERRTGIRCRVSTKPAGFETQAHVTIAYRILLEALTNVARHAHAGTVWIQVHQQPDRLVLKVRDNGKGISPEAMANPTTLGLLGMRERALSAGGDVRISRLAGGGTTVLITLPLKQNTDPTSAATDA